MLAARAADYSCACVGAVLARGHGLTCTSIRAHFAGRFFLEVVDAPEVELHFKQHLGARNVAKHLKVTVRRGRLGIVRLVKPVLDPDDG